MDSKHSVSYPLEKISLCTLTAKYIYVRHMVNDEANRNRDEMSEFWVSVGIA